MQPQFRLGLRTIKTALSVMLSLYVTSLFGELTIFPALASIGVMSRTFDEGLNECRSQAIGIIVGGLFGCLAALAFPNPPAWLIAFGVMIIIFLCASFHVGFATSLSCAIFIVACMSDPNDVVHSVVVRLLHTAIGLAIGLFINYFIIPYNNSRKIYSKLEELQSTIPQLMTQLFSQQVKPDLKPLHTLLEQLDYEMSVYRHQRFLRKRQHQELYRHMSACAQAAELLYQELTVLCRMSSLGLPSQENTILLQCMGLPSIKSSSTASEEEAVVTNYHLSQLLEYNTTLTRLLKTRI